MSEAATADLATPAPAAEAAPAPAPAAAPAAGAAADATLETPAAVQGEEAAASGQGDGEGEAAPKGGVSEGEEAEGAKPEGDKPAEDAATGAPEAYADFDMPEGFTLPADYGTELTGLAKELNLTQAQAQAVVNLGVKHAQGLQTQLAESAKAAAAVWADEVRADVEIGGVKLAENMTVAKKAMVAFGSPKLTGLLNQTGLSKHPEVLRLLVRVGEAISEDTLVTGGSSEGGQPAQKDHAKRLYPGLK